DGCSANDFTVTITHAGSDQTGPTFTTLSDQMVMAPSTDCSAFFAVPVPTDGTDNCGSLPITYSIATSNPSVHPMLSAGQDQWESNWPVGVTTVFVTATDNCGAETTLSFTITVDLDPNQSIMVQGCNEGSE